MFRKLVRVYKPSLLLDAIRRAAGGVRGRLSADRKRLSGILSHCKARIVHLKRPSATGIVRVWLSVCLTNAPCSARGTSSPCVRRAIGLGNVSQC